MAVQRSGTYSSFKSFDLGSRLVHVAFAIMLVPCMAPAQAMPRTGAGATSARGSSTDSTVAVAAGSPSSQTTGTPTAPVPVPPAEAGPRGYSIVQSPPPLALLWGRSTSLGIVATHPVTHLRVLGSTLTEATLPVPLPGDAIRLCRTTASDTAAPVLAPCDGMINLSKNEAATLRLVVSPSFTTPGKYKGSVLLIADGESTPLNVEWMVYSSDLKRRVLGAGIILIGIILAWIMAVVVRSGVARDEALLPAARLREAAQRLDSRVDIVQRTCHATCAVTAGALKKASGDLDESVLEQNDFIARRHRFPLTQPPDKSAAYQQYLNQISVVLAIVDVVLREGLERVIQVPNPTSDDVKHQVLDIDAVSGKAQTAVDAHTQVASKLAPATTKGVYANSDQARPHPARNASVGELTFEIGHLNTAGWLIWGALTWLVGIVALVWSNYAFGAGLDYWTCFFWGFGIPIAGQQLQQLSPTSAGTALGISFPKS